MKRFDAIIIGGGVTGAGIARDLALRGLSVLLVERKDFASGATGGCHGLLHSGGRYVVKDPESAKECAKENIILRKIAKHIIDDTGGLFIALKEDPEDYPEKFLRGCKSTGVVCKSLLPSEALKLEPNINPDIREAFWVNDASIDPFLLTLLNLLDAHDSGAVIKNYSEVVGFITRGNEITRVKILDHRKKILEEFQADTIVNAAGAWTGKIAALAGITLPIQPNQGTLIVATDRIVNRVINRLRPPSDGDIIVPHHTTSILGTTSVNITDPDKAFPTQEEVLKLYREGVKTIPKLRNYRFIRVYAAVRPLVGAGTGRDISRTFVIFDHENDGFSNFITIAGGKLTTYRLMAEKASDIVMKKLGKSGKCVTHKEPLPGFYDEKELTKLLKKAKFMPEILLKAFNKWGLLARRFLRDPEFNDIVCECEMVSKAEIRYAIKHTWALRISDLRRRTRLSMGPCQGQNCLLPSLGIIHEETNREELELVKEYLKYLEGRFSPLKPLLYGSQARQYIFTLSILRILGNFDKLRGL